VVLTLSGASVSVVSGSAKFTLATMPVEEYPNLPAVEGTSGSVSGEEFAQAVGQVAPAASRDDVTPVITGVLFRCLIGCVGHDGDRSISSRR